MNELFKVKKGNLSYKDKVENIHFGIIYKEVDGLIILEAFLNSDEFYKKFKADKEEFKPFFTFKGVSTELDEIEIPKLRFWKYEFEKSIIHLIINNYLIKYREDEKIKNVTEHSVHRMELEGFNHEFYDITEFQTYDGNNKHNSWTRDHTKALLHINPGDIVPNAYNLLFHNLPGSDNIVLSITKNFKLKYKDYLQLKETLVDFLSFLNGGTVTIRKEYTGSMYYTDQLGSSIEISYSFKKLSINGHSDYFPIRVGRFQGNWLGQAFVRCFSKFYDLSKMIDWSSIVYSLNSANNLPNYVERFYLLITLFEKLAKQYSNILEPKEKLIISTEDFDIIKEKLEEIISQNKNILCGKSEIFKNRINQLNISKKGSVESRLINLLNGANVSLSKEIEEIIYIDRNNSVHEGKVGDDFIDGLEKYYLLDKTIRDIILNLIGYEGLRKKVG